MEKENVVFLAIPLTVPLERYMLQYTAQVRPSDCTKVRPYDGFTYYVNYLET